MGKAVRIPEEAAAFRAAVRLSEGKACLRMVGLALAFAGSDVTSYPAFIRVMLPGTRHAAGQFCVIPQMKALPPCIIYLPRASQAH